MRLVRFPPKTLAFLLSILRHGPNPRNLHSAPEHDLVLRFSKALKHFSRNPPLSPQIGARPRNPHPFEYNALMKEFGRSGNFREVLRLFEEMKCLHCKPDVVCYSTVINCLVVVNRAREAQTVFAEMIVLGMEPDVACFTILMWACSEPRRLQHHNKRPIHHTRQARVSPRQLSILMRRNPNLANICLFTTLIRFDLVCYVLFKCTKKKLIKCPNLHAYTHDIYQIPNVAETCNFDAIMDGCYRVWFPLNPGPGRIRPVVPDVSEHEFLSRPHDRVVIFL